MDTTTSSPRSEPGTGTSTVSVALTADVHLSVESLQRALSSNRPGLAISWDVTLINAAVPGTPADMALCEVESVSVLRRRWPECALIAVVAARDDGTGVVAALEAGADSCIRESNVALAGAFILAMARRRGLISEELYR